MHFSPIQEKHRQVPPPVDSDALFFGPPPTRFAQQINTNYKNLTQAAARLKTNYFNNSDFDSNIFSLCGLSSTDVDPIKEKMHLEIIELLTKVNNLAAKIENASSIQPNFKEINVPLLRLEIKALELRLLYLKPLTQPSLANATQKNEKLKEFIASASGFWDQARPNFQLLDPATQERYNKLAAFYNIVHDFRTDQRKKAKEAKQAQRQLAAQAAARFLAPQHSQTFSQHTQPSLNRQPSPLEVLDLTGDEYTDPLMPAPLAYSMPAQNHPNFMSFTQQFAPILKPFQDAGFSKEAEMVWNLKANSFFRFSA